MIEALALHTMLFGLGYSLGTEVFYEVSAKRVVVLLRVRGKKPLGFSVGVPEMTPEEMATRWKNLIDEWNTGGTFSDEEKEVLFNMSNISKRSLEVVAQLVAHDVDRSSAPTGSEYKKLN
jgi:hypothetical protein